MSGYEKDLQIPGPIGGAGSPAHTPPGQKEESIPAVIGGATPSMGMPTERPLVLPPVIG